MRTRSVTVGASAAAGDGFSGSDATPEVQPKEIESESNVAAVQVEPMSWWRRMSSFDRKKLASLGTSVLLSYGFVSNVSYVGCLHIATFTAMQQTGKSPFTNPVGLKAFVTVYTGLWVILNFMRPARIALSISLGAVFEKIVNFFHAKFRLKNKAYAFALTVFFVNIVGTMSFMFGGIAICSAITGVPVGWGGLGQAFVEAKKAATAAVLGAVS